MAETTQASKPIYLGIAWVCVALGIIGAFLPLMPTTVFLLIAAWAFAKSSPKRHQWLREHAKFGHLIRAWEEHHAMPRRAKRIALTAMALSYAATAYFFGPFSWTAIIGGIFIAGAAIYVAHIPVLCDQSLQQKQA